ncbi:MAG: hypothetical protein EXR93_11860 [Gemmatimonadetes bacterium]|nr:hypothetical protein [Gemmatimonadota bacterium]
MRLVILLPAALLLTPVANLVGQGSIPAIGARIRIHHGWEQRITDDGRTLYQPLPISTALVSVGTLRAVSGDTFMLAAVGTSDVLRIPFAAVSRFEVSQGRRAHSTRGALIGLLVGAAVGAGVGLATYAPCQPKELFSCWLAPTTAGQAAVLSAAFGGVSGLLIGAVVGTVGVEGWHTMPLPGTERN